MELFKFKQPTNKENNLKATLDGYKKNIGEQYPEANWRSHAFQKDGIQNSYGAIPPQSKNEWQCILFIEKYQGIDYVGIIDSGTTGLKGRVPNKDLNIMTILSEVSGTNREEDENLAFFLSSDWSNKTNKNSGGSRGRGKNVYFGCSKGNKFYFDSLRNNNSYIFGCISLDADSKEIDEWVEEDNNADIQRKNIFGERLARLDKPGTRILIPNPNEYIEESFKDGSLIEYIQETWWEILEKQDADIRLNYFGRITKVPKSKWLPVTNLGLINTTRVYDKESELRLKRARHLKVKKMSFCFVEDESTLPEDYRGIAIQRDGMVIQRIKTKNLCDIDGASEIYGTVELSSDLAEIIKKEYEDPEHYSLIYNSGVGRDLKDLIKFKLQNFADEVGLNKQEDERRIKRASEVEVQKKLNALAKKLGFKMTGRGQIDKNKTKQQSPETEYPIRLSFSGLKTEQDYGRVDYGEFLREAFVTPINDDESLNPQVKIKCWFLYRGEDGKMKEPEDLSGILEPRIRILNLKSSDKINPIGWDELEITKEIFQKPGVYDFKAKIIALENISIKWRKKDGRTQEDYIKKSDPIGDTIREPFYVNIDKPDKGLFNISSKPSEEKSDYYKWDTIDGIEVKYNDQHPIWKSIQKIRPKKDQSIFEQMELAKMGITALATLAYDQDKELIEKGENPLVYSRDDIDLNGANMTENTKQIIKKLSEIYWDLGY